MPIRLLLTTLLLCSSATGLAQSANEYFEEGNRLFREDLTHAALLRYRQAAGSGLDTPRLHYNMGVANYKVGQYERAREALLKSERDPALAQISRYNLGLTAWKSDNESEALSWFRQARDGSNERIAGLARTAIGRMRTPAREEREAIVERRRRQEDEPSRFDNLDVRARVGFGNNDNVFRSPAVTYTDFGANGNPTVAPVTQSGAYVPVNVRLRYNINSTLFENFYVAYQLDGDFYQDQQLDNANEFSQEVSFGNSFEREKNGVESTVYSAFEVAQHQETWFDPDDGLERDVRGVGVGDRLNYRRYGPVLRLRRASEKLALGMVFKGQLRNYDDVEVVPEYDHEYLRLGLSGQYRFTSSSLLRISVDGIARRYGDRPSFNLNGEQLLGNPSLEYQYVSASLLARQRLLRSAWFGIEYERTERTDGFVGYNDFSRDAFEVDIFWRPNPRFRLRAVGRYSLYDFPNAFAFNNNLLSRRTLETADAEVEARWRMTKSLSLLGTVRFSDVVSNDTRIQYEQTRAILSVLWER